MHKKSDASWGRLPWWKAAKICKKRTKLSWHFVFSFSFFRVRAYLIYIRQGLYLRRGNDVTFSPLTDVAQATVRHKAEGGFDGVS